MWLHNNVKGMSDEHAKNTQIGWQKSAVLGSSAVFSALWIIVGKLWKLSSKYIRIKTRILIVKNDIYNVCLLLGAY